MFYRRAGLKDLELLNQILYDSEKYWNHDKIYMAGFASLYRLTEKYLAESIVWIMEADGTIIGFFCIKPAAEAHELDYFYIRRDRIGEGFGRRLWQHLQQVCRDQGISRLTWVTDPGALPFYLKMGAWEIGWTRSKINGKRLIPKLEYILPLE